MMWLAGIAIVLLLVVAVGVWEVARILRHTTVQQAALVQLLERVTDEQEPREIAKAIWAERERLEREDRRWTDAGL